MKEKEIRLKAMQILKDLGYAAWRPMRNRYRNQDIFGVFDAIGAKGNEILFIQWTTYPNISARLHKIEKFLEENKVELRYQVWGWKKRGKGGAKGHFVVRSNFSEK